MCRIICTLTQYSLKFYIFFVSKRVIFLLKHAPEFQYLNCIFSSTNDLYCFYIWFKLERYSIINPSFFKFIIFSQLVFAFEQINHNQLSKTLEMILTCCYCNEAFSANFIHQILIHVNNSSFNEIKQVLNLLYNIIVIRHRTVSRISFLIQIS